MGLGATGWVGEFVFELDRCHEHHLGKLKVHGEIQCCSRSLVRIAFSISRINRFKTPNRKVYGKAHQRTITLMTRMHFYQAEIPPPLLERYLYYFIMAELMKNLRFMDRAEVDVGLVVKLEK
ncbi:hypothetical protein AMTRI_Chr07g25250 [Amborella trichopoda]